MNSLKRNTSVIVVLAFLVGMSVLIGNEKALQAKSGHPDPALTLAVAEGLVENGMRDAALRGEAMVLYEDVLASVTGADSLSRSYQARAHLGLALIHTFDLLDLIPALSNFLGINLSDLLGSLGSLSAAASPAGFQVAATCTPTDFEDYLWTLNALLTNMVAPIAEDFKAALELDPAVTLRLSDAWVTIIPDDPLTPADEAITLDLSGEWDAADTAFFQGALQAILGGLKILAAYDGPLQNFANPAITPDCVPVPGSADWTALFGPYGQLVQGGVERMTESGELLAEGLRALGEGLTLLAGETDDQNNDVIKYEDVGEDGLAPGDTTYPGPDADGTESNHQYDPGEPWGMASVGQLLDSLLGGLLGGGLPVSLSQVSQILTLPVLTGLMNSLSDSAENGTPVDLIPTLLKPLLSSFGMSMTDQELYGLGLPALNLGALYHPPLADFSVFSALTDAAGTVIAEPESGDTAHAWPDASGRVDAPNASLDPNYTFMRDRDAGGNAVGVFGGIILLPVTDPSDFDASGNLIGTVDYLPMMNPQYNSLLTVLGGLLGP